MKKNRKIKWFRLFLIVTCVALLILTLFFVFNPQKEIEEVVEDENTLNEGGQTKPDESNTNDEIQVDIVSSIVFDLDDFNFRFAVVKLRVKTEGSSINIGLDKFKTSEGIVLDDVDFYIDELQKQQCFLGKQNVWQEIVSSEATTMVNVFVPIKDNNISEIEIETDFNTPRSMSVSLKNPKGTKEMLMYEADDIVTDGKTYQMKVSEAFDITGDTMIQTIDGESTEYLLPSTVSVYAFKVTMVSLWGDSVIIEEAQYIPDSSNEVLIAMDSSIQSMKYSNIIGNEVIESDSGDLFFTAYNPIEEKVSYRGILKLKLKDQKDWVIINVDLN
ncbi:MAG: hypothetical protein ACK5KQ_05170 [Anaerorhabdus sp.]